MVGKELRNSYLISPLHVGYLYFIRPSPETSMQVCFISISRPVPNSPVNILHLFLNLSSPGLFWSSPLSLFKWCLPHCNPWYTALHWIWCLAKRCSVLSNLQIHRVWKVSILFEMAFVIFQDSAPYRRTPKHITLKDRGNKSWHISSQKTQSFVNADYYWIEGSLWVWSGILWDGS